MNTNEIREILDDLHDRYNRPEFIESDPISIPHLFSERGDREVSGFLTATIAWGNRKAILKSARRMMEFMDWQPESFVKSASAVELDCLERFVHRTFNGTDFRAFVLALRRLYEVSGGIGNFVEESYLRTEDMRLVLAELRQEFFAMEHPQRSEKHLSSIAKGASCKRLNMYFRWMVRKDNRGVDFGLWDKIPASALYLPLDLHSGNVARGLGLLERKQNDWRAVEEVTDRLRQFDPQDPVKYDFALFGAGVFRGATIE